MECHTGQSDKNSIWAKPKIWRPSIEFQRIKTNIDNCTSNYSLYVILIQNNRGYNNSTVMGRATIPTPPPSFNRSSNSPNKATWLIIIIIIKTKMSSVFGSGIRPITIPAKHQMECLGWELRIALTGTQLFWQRMLRTQWTLRTVSVKKVPWSKLKIGLGISITTLAKQPLPHNSTTNMFIFLCTKQALTWSAWDFEP